MKITWMATAALLAAAPAHATTTITQLATGASATLDMATDGANKWPAHLIWDGTTWATVNASDSGLTVHVANWISTLAVTQSGTWTIGGTLPAFASTPTVNIGTMPAVSLTANGSTVSTAAPFPVTCISGCSGGGGGGNTAAAAIGSASPTYGSVTAFVNSSGTLVAGALNADGGLPAHVTNWPSSQAVTGTFWQTTQPVSLSSLPALASGSNVIGAVTQSGGPWSISASALPLPSGAATAANQTSVQSAPGSSAATAVTIQGSASGVAVPVSGAFWQATQPVSLASLPALATGSNVIGAVTQSGTWTTGRTWSLSSADDSVAIGGTLPAFASTPTVNVGTMPSVAVTGSFWQATQPVSAASLPLPSGAATAAKQPTLDGDGGAPAHVTNWPSSQAVTGTFWQTTQPVSLAGLPALATGSNTIGKVDQGAANATPWNDNVAQIGGNAVATGNGASNSGTQRVIIATDSPNSAFSAVSIGSLQRYTGTSAYTANTGWNNSSAATSFTFANACRANGGAVLIPEVDIYSSVNPTTKLSGVLWLFSASIGTPVADAASFTILPADFANVTGPMQGIGFSLGNTQASGAANSATALTGTTYHAQCASGSTSIYGMVEVTNAYTPGASETLTIKLHTIGVN